MIAKFFSKNNGNQEGMGLFSFRLFHCLSRDSEIPPTRGLGAPKKVTKVLTMAFHPIIMTKHTCHTLHLRIQLST